MISYSNPKEFTEMVNTLVNYLDNVSEKSYLAAKLVSRFDESPMAIPKTNLLLLHTQSHAIVESQFLVVQLDKPVLSKSMNHELEEVHRVLVMLTKINESDEVRDLMTAISQSIIENNLYTEIYKTGNREILYQLLNTIFNERIKNWRKKMKFEKNLIKLNQSFDSKEEAIRYCGRQLFEEGMSMNLILML